MADVVQILQRLGFGEYEARAYAALLQHSPANGYELAKLSGLPRANIYGVLQKLEERGAVVSMDTPSSTRYAAVPPDELTQRLDARFRDDLEAARSSLDELSNPVQHEYVWNTEGYAALLEQARTLLDGARGRVLVAVWPQESPHLAASLDAATSRGVEITTLCLGACAVECGGCRGSIFRYRAAPEHSSRWLLVVLDGEEMLAGEIMSEHEAHAVRTRQPLLVELASWYIRHSIALGAVVGELGDRLPKLLSPGTLSALASLGPGGLQVGWLEYMRGLLNMSGVVDG
jgi:hypothetical protein